MPQLISVCSNKTFFSSCKRQYWNGWDLSSAKTLIETQPAITCSKLTIETIEQGVKYVQSQ